ncbi:hypothetical protein DTO164E3_668 [Paecilomyces variotii]|nr:hypothetical protein DTO164E3_668 [Paecilomyces variotii]
MKRGHDTTSDRLSGSRREEPPACSSAVLLAPDAPSSCSPAVLLAQDARKGDQMPVVIWPHGNVEHIHDRVYLDGLLEHIVLVIKVKASLLSMLINEVIPINVRELPINALSLSAQECIFP